MLLRFDCFPVAASELLLLSLVAVIADASQWLSWGYFPLLLLLAAFCGLSCGCLKIAIFFTGCFPLLLLRNGWSGVLSIAAAFTCVLLVYR